MAAVLEARDLWKSYGEAQVLRRVSFKIPRRSMVALTGRSGSGKSTLFKLLAGLDRPTLGDVIVDDVHLKDLDDRAMSDVRLRRIGLVFQSFNLLPDLTILENVRFPMDIAGVRRRDATMRALELLDLVHLRELSSKLPNVLSGGEMQRAAIARALANDPSIILADEPTGSLDAVNAKNVLDVFRSVNKRLGTTILIISHDPLVVDSLPSRLHLESGEVAWETPPAPEAVG